VSKASVFRGARRSELPWLEGAHVFTHLQDRAGHLDEPGIYSNEFQPEPSWRFYLGLTMERRSSRPSRLFRNRRHCFASFAESQSGSPAARP
jgi:hypothetical protein